MLLEPRHLFLPHQSHPLLQVAHLPSMRLLLLHHHQLQLSDVLLKLLLSADMLLLCIMFFLDHPPKSSIGPVQRLLHPADLVLLNRLALVDYALQPLNV